MCFLVLLFLLFAYRRHYWYGGYHPYSYYGYGPYSYPYGAYSYYDPHWRARRYYGYNSVYQPYGCY
jgi:hypothetical protein